jgi:hypothetical protein
MRTLLTIAALLATLLVAGCADGWPRVHHKAVWAVDCVPTASRIGRNSCVTTNPTMSTTGEAADKEQQPGQSVVRPPVSNGPGPR